MRFRVLLFTILAALPAAAHHGGGSTSAGGGQLTMSPEGPTAGKLYADLRIDYSTYREFTDDELHRAVEDERDRHSVDHDVTYALDAGIGISELLSVGISVPYKVIASFREAEEDSTFGESVTGRNIQGLGDIPVFVHLTILHSAFKLGVRAGIEIPFGRTNVRTVAGDEKLEASHQPGSGSYDFFGGVAIGYATGPLEVDASLTGQYNTLGSRSFKIGYNVVLSVGGSLNLLPVAMKAKFGPTVDVQALWKARDRNHAEGLEDSSGWEYIVAPGLRFGAGPVFAEVASPIVLQNTIYEHNHQRFRIVLTVGVKF